MQNSFVVMMTLVPVTDYLLGQLGGGEREEREKKTHSKDSKAVWPPGIEKTVNLVLDNWSCQPGYKRFQVHSGLLSPSEPDQGDRECPRCQRQEYILYCIQICWLAFVFVSLLVWRSLSEYEHVLLWIEKTTLTLDAFFPLQFNTCKWHNWSIKCLRIPDAFCCLRVKLTLPEVFVCLNVVYTFMDFSGIAKI